MSNCRMMWIHAITPVHVGCGFGVGAVDLPVVREKATGWPVLPGSGIKGVLADRFDASDAKSRDNLKAAAFGRPDTVDNGTAAPANAGALVVGDARIVALPVRSLYGTWAWVSCPLALGRLRRDLAQTAAVPALEQTRPAPAADAMLVSGTPPTKLRIGPAGKAFLADLDISVSADPAAELWASSLARWLFGGPGSSPAEQAWVAEFIARFGIVHDDLFNYLLETGLEVATRIHVDPNTGAVAKGQLWVEEALPAETVMASLVWADQVRSPRSEVTPEKVLKAYCGVPLNLQLGGKATVGRGRVRATFSGE